MTFQRFGCARLVEIGLSAQGAGLDALLSVIEEIVRYSSHIDDAIVFLCGFSVFWYECQESNQQDIGVEAYDCDNSR